jgi:hypothetical protein
VTDNNYSAEKMFRVPLLLAIMTVVGCVSAPRVAIAPEFGRHQLPYRPNERFVLIEVDAPTDFSAFDSPITITYFLDGKRRTSQFAAAGATDGYVTYLGRLLAAEIEGVESPIMDENVIRLTSGEEITVSGNTVNRGGIRLRRTNEAKQT